MNHFVLAILIFLGVMLVLFVAGLIHGALIMKQVDAIEQQNEILRERIERLKTGERP